MAKNPGQAVTSGRDQVLDATESCLRRFGIAKTTIEDVAREAGLSRATVYRQFGNRDALLLAVAARDAERAASDAELYLRRFEDVGSWIVEGILFCLREIPERPLLALFLSPQELGTASRMLLTSDRMLAIGAEILRPMFEPAHREGLLRPGLDFEELMEWVLRIVMSYLAVAGPASRTEQDLRAMLHRMLLPAVLKDPDAAAATPSPTPSPTPSSTPNA